MRAKITKAMLLAGIFTLLGLGAEADDTKADDWAQFYRYRQANADTAAHGADAVFMGNSITDNWAKYDPDFFAGNGYVGRGISGQTTSEMLVRFRRDVIDLAPKVVVILAGTNDVAGNNGQITLEDAAGNIQSMCELARANGIIPILCSVTPCDHFSWRPQARPGKSIIELNALLRQYALEAGIDYVDYHSAMADTDGAMLEGLSSDGCHPTIEGYKIMEAIVAPRIEAALQGAAAAD